MKPKNWTHYKIKVLANKLIDELKRFGIKARRADISRWGQVIVKIGDNFVAGLDFRRPGWVDCTAGGRCLPFAASEYVALAEFIAKRHGIVREQTAPAVDDRPTRLEVRGCRPF